MNECDYLVSLMHWRHPTTCKCYMDNGMTSSYSSVEIDGSNLDLYLMAWQLHCNHNLAGGRRYYLGGSILRNGVTQYLLSLVLIDSTGVSINDMVIMYCLAQFSNQLQQEIFLQHKISGYLMSWWE